MEQSIAPTVGGALAFGWQHLRAIATQNLGIFAALLLLGVALTVWAAAPQHFQTASIEWVAGIAALGAIVRVFRPQFSMTGRTVLGIVGIYAVFAAVGIVTIGTPVFIAVLFHLPALLWLTVVEVPVAIWLIVKYSAAAPLYALRSQEDVSIFKALAESGERVSGEVWGRMFLAQLCAGIPFVVPAALLSLIAFTSMSRSNTTLAALVAATLWYLGAIPGYAFNMAVTMGVVASADPRIEPAEAV